MEAVKDILPAAEHRQCGRHIFANFQKRFKGAQFKSMFWAAAKATTPRHFDIMMKRIKDVCPQAYTYLMDRDPKCWSRAFFKFDTFCVAVENGICESFNSAIEFARRRPIVTMLEEIRIYVMERMTKKLIKGNKWKGSICPSIQKIVDALKIIQR